MLCLQDQRADGTRMLLVKFGTDTGNIIKIASILTDIYPSSSDVQSNYLSIFGRKPDYTQIVYLRIYLGNYTIECMQTLPVTYAYNLLVRSNYYLNEFIIAGNGKSFGSNPSINQIFIFSKLHG